MQRQGWKQEFRSGRAVRYAGLLAMAAAAMAQDQPQRPAGPMRGMMGEAAGDMRAIHALFDSHERIMRTVNRLDNGVETLTESDDPNVQALIRQHVRSMYERLNGQRPIRTWDPLYAEIFKHASKIKMEMRDTAKGIQVIETSADPWVVKLLHSHADGVSEFVKEGTPVMHKVHPLPSGGSDVKVVPLRTALEAGKDREVEPLFEGPGRKLVQITLRNKATLLAHKAAVPVTIQCIAGSGVLKTGDGAGSVALQPGVLVTLEANVMHEVQANPAVSILLTHFTAMH